MLAHLPRRKLPRLHAYHLQSRTCLPACLPGVVDRCVHSAQQTDAKASSDEYSKQLVWFV